jgi:hypothetical protein
MISRLSDGEISDFAKRIPGFASVAALAMILAGLTQAQLIPSQIDSTAVRPSLNTPAEIPAAAQSVVSATLGRADEAYRAKSSGQGYATANPATHMAAQYAADGVKIRFQNADLDLEFQGWGYGKADVKQDRADVVPFVDANRVEYRRGTITEWYVNGPLGIEQGFTISRAPVASSKSQHDTLEILLRVGGNLRASVEPGRHALTLRNRNGVATLRYGPLLAYDASGRELGSWMEEQDGTLRLCVSAAGARYPIIVDPWVQAAQLTNSSGLEGDQFGRSIAVSGNTVVVGAPFVNAYKGVAYVFVAPTVSGVPTWASTGIYTAELSNSSGAAGDNFGSSVGISGNTIVVSAPDVTFGSNAGQGAAYVFVEPTVGGVPTWASTGIYTAELSNSSGAAGDHFGSSVGISGGTIVVGATQANDYQGAAYVFVAPSVGGVSTWTSTGIYNAELTAMPLTYSGAPTEYYLGYSVGINESGNSIVVGAPSSDTGLQGAAYVFVEPSNGVWATPQTNPTYNAELTDGYVPTGGDQFGYAVGISGNTVVVSAPFATVYSPITNANNVEQGAAYVFVAPTVGGVPTWTSTSAYNAELTASNGSSENFLGTSAGISGNTVVVGASGAGAAYVFVEPSAGGVPTWTSETETTELSASGETYADLFGYTVGISGNTVVAGAPGVTVGTNTYQGAAYVFTGSSGPYAQYSPQGPLIQFGSVNINTTSTQTLTLTNTGSPAFTVSGISLSGTSSAFSVPNVVCTGSGNTVSPPYTSMTVSLAQGDTCTITLQFAPTLVQNGQAEALSIATNATNSNAAELGGGGGQAFNLVGQGVEPIATFSPTQLNFGNVVDNVPSTQTVTVTNSGNGTLNIQLVLPSQIGTGFSDPQYTCSLSGSLSSPSYPFTLNPNDYCTYTVQFDPTTPGPVSIGLGFGDNAGSGESNLPSTSYGTYYVQSVPLSGTGVTSIASIATTTTITSTSSSFLGYPLPPGFALVNNPITVNYTVLPVSGNAIATGTVIVEDGAEEFCTPPGTLTSANNGKGSCTLTINSLGSGSTPLSAQYTPDAASSSNGLLESATVAPLFTETVVEIINCGTPPPGQSLPAGTPATFTGNICLATGLVGVATVQADVSSGCPEYLTCSVTVTPVQGQSGLYTVVLTLTPSGSGGSVPLQIHSPLTGPPSLIPLEFGLLLAMLLALGFARGNMKRPRFAYASGLVIVLAMLLGGVNSCGSSSKHETPANTYTINVTISAGTYNVTMPFTLTVTN